VVVLILTFVRSHLEIPLYGALICNSLFSHRAMPVLALTPEFSYSRSSFVFHLLQHAYACFHSSLLCTNSRVLLFFFLFFVFFGGGGGFKNIGFPKKQ